MKIWVKRILTLTDDLERDFTAARVVVFKLIEYKIPLDRINVLKYDNREIACRQIGSGQRIEVTGNLSATCENKALFC